MADPEIARCPPAESEFVWIREDRVLSLLQEALDEAIETHGNKAKAFAWDARYNFKRRIADNA